MLQAVASAVQKDLSSADESVLAAMRTVHWMAKEDVPVKKYSSLMELQKLQGCEAVSNLSVSRNATYMSRGAGQDFQSCVAEEIHRRVVQNIRDASMYSILIDESTDISITKHMVVYASLGSPVCSTHILYKECDH